MNKPASVTLKADPNPDFDWPDYRATIRIAETEVPVSTIEEASTICSKFIEDHDLGGGNWTGGQIKDAQGEVIATVSYNGRVWKGSDCMSMQEIERHYE